MHPCRGDRADRLGKDSGPCPADLSPPHNASPTVENYKNYYYIISEVTG